MSTSNNSSKAMDWIIFLVTAVITIALLVIAPAWFWVTLPFPLTYLVRALDMM